VRGYRELKEQNHDEGSKVAAAIPHLILSLVKGEEILRAHVE